MAWEQLGVVAGGAVAGAWLRWGLGMALNPVFPTLPLGTLAANLIGGFLMGLILRITQIYSTVPPLFRLGFTTGFLGGLTTFSAFSGEAAILLLERTYLWATLHILAHVLGSIGLTITGMFLVKWIL